MQGETSGEREIPGLLRVWINKIKRSKRQDVRQASSRKGGLWWVPAQSRVLWTKLWEARGCAGIYQNLRKASSFLSRAMDTRSPGLLALGAEVKAFDFAFLSH